MFHSTLCYVFREKPKRQILLGLKKKRLGKGKLNGFGGKVEKRESLEEAAARELLEESGITVDSKNLEKVGELKFEWVSKMEWNQLCHVFVAKKWQGEAVETDEMKPEWVDVEKIPFERMWAEDKHWLPLVLKKRHVKGKFVFGRDEKSIEKMELKHAEKLFKK